MAHSIPIALFDIFAVTFALVKLKLLPKSPVWVVKSLRSLRLSMRPSRNSSWR